MRTTPNLEVQIALKPGQSETVADLCSAVCGREMTIARQKQGRKLERFQLREKIKLDAFIGAVQQPAPENEVCGDTYARFPVEQNYEAFVISDGMGVGEAAAAESRATVGLLKDLFAAGYSKEFVLDMVNRLLLLKGEENYATVDLCIIDRVQGRAEFIKVGAAPSYVFYGGNVDQIQAASLPIGILEEMTPSVETCVLAGMEYIVMVSDGVQDCAGEDMPLWISELKSRDCKAMARELLNRARKNGLKDDATVLVIGVEATGNVFQNNVELIFQ